MKRTSTLKLAFLILATLILLAFAFFGCSPRPDEVEQSITGRIAVVGNEPFTKLALQTYNETFILKCDDAMKQELWQLQGAMVTVYYVTMTVEQGMKTIHVTRYALYGNERMKSEGRSLKKRN